MQALRAAAVRGLATPSPFSSLLIARCYTGFACSCSLMHTYRVACTHFPLLLLACDTSRAVCHLLTLFQLVTPAKLWHAHTIFIGKGLLRSVLSVLTTWVRALRRPARRCQAAAASSSKCARGGSADQDISSAVEQAVLYLRRATPVQLLQSARAINRFRLQAWLGLPAMCMPSRDAKHTANSPGPTGQHAQQGSWMAHRPAAPQAPAATRIFSGRVRRGPRPGSRGGAYQPCCEGRRGQ